MSAVDYGREALDFIEGLEAYRKVPDVMDALEAAFGRFGFETIIVTGLPNSDQCFAQMVLAKRWPEVPAISDPDKALFHAFDLRRGSLGQLFGPRVFKALTGINHEIRAGALFGVRHLAGENSVKMGLGHSGPRQHTFGLHLSRGGHDNHVHTHRQQRQANRRRYLGERHRQ